MQTITRDELTSTAPNGVYCLGDRRDHDRIYVPVLDEWQEGPSELYGRVDDRHELPAGCEHAALRADGKRAVIIRAIVGTVSEV